MRVPVVICPSSAEDWERYFDLRWRVLRAPWNQPRGSETDDRDGDSTHLMAIDSEGQALAVGRLHFNSAAEAQVRFMAVAESARNRGLGSVLLAELEKQARAAGAARVVLHSREGAQHFYEKNGYRVTGLAPTLFDAIKHVRMAKDLRAGD